MAGLFVVAVMVAAYKRDSKELNALKHKAFGSDKQAVSAAVQDAAAEEAEEEVVSADSDDDRQRLIQRDSMSDDEQVKARLSIASWSEFDNNWHPPISYTTTVGPPRSKHAKRSAKSKPRALFALQLY